jgi:hypothetical protein
MGQNDSIGLKGTIKVSKAKKGTVYITSTEKFRYELSEAESARSLRNTIFQPFPVVEGHAFPFNYSKYFREKFRNEKIDLKGKLSDTVKIEIKITPKGKVYLHNNSKDKNDILNLQCIGYIKDIKQWMPGYFMIAEKGVYKKQTVIEPKKINVSSVGTITIIFSSEDPEN